MSPVTLREALAALVHQIEINDFADSHFHEAKMLKALQDARAALAAPEAADEVERLRQALRFYAQGNHFTITDETAWDTVSGEPPNFWCDEAGTAMVEDGRIAAMALRGELIDWDEDGAPAPIDGECPAPETAATPSDVVVAKCAECGKTSTPDSMWALYCLDCVGKIAPAVLEAAATPSDAQTLVVELTHALAWADQEARELHECAFLKREAKAKRATAAIQAAIAALAAAPAQPAAQVPQQAAQTQEAARG